LQQVLPKGFVKVRCFGFFAPSCRKRLPVSTRLDLIFTHSDRFLAVFGLATIDFLVVQFMHTRSQEYGFGVAICLKFQITRYVS
jgi:hypothetical protein